jgi:S-adenosylmethionine:tRNA ribosyltransferase-isomerase
MVLKKDTGEITHDLFKNIGNYLNPEDVIVYNNTKVFPAKLIGKKEKTEADIEVFLLRELKPEQMLWDVLVEPARKIRIGNKLYFGDDDDLVAEVVDNTTSRGRTIRFLFDGPNEDLYAKLDALGMMPLPPFIDRKPELADKTDYQTIFATERGAVAAPSAGMHFTQELVDQLKANKIDFVPITLHIGWGAFRPVEVEDLTKHKTDSESYFISNETSERVNKARKKKKNRVISCGSTACRVLETSITAAGLSKMGFGWTDKFLFPPFQFKVTEGLIINFHRPESTQLMLAAAFAGYEFMMKAYEVAQKEKYDFFTFGDAMLIL